jgi:hypothetical protein
LRGREAGRQSNGDCAEVALRFGDVEHRRGDPLALTWLEHHPDRARILTGATPDDVLRRHDVDVLSGSGDDDTGTGVRRHVGKRRFDHDDPALGAVTIGIRSLGADSSRRRDGDEEGG